MAGSSPQSDAVIPRQGRRSDLLARFLRAREGATAVEFGILAMPFFLLLFAIIETVMMFWTNAVLEEAVTEVSRTLLTGQSQALYAGANASKFQTNICNYSPGFIDCGRLHVDVQTFTSFSNAATGSPLSGVIDTTSFAYRQPKPGDIVVVRAVLEYDVFLSQWSSVFAKTEDGARSLAAAAVFQTEPYTVSSGPTS